MSQPVPPIPSPSSDSHPALERFIRVVRSRFDPVAIDTFWTFEDEFRILAASGFCAAYLRRQLQQMIDRPEDFGRWYPSSVVAFSMPAIALTILALERAPTITAATFLGMYVPLSGPLHVDVYALPEGHRNDEFSPTTQLTKLRSDTIAVGEVLLLRDTDRYIYDFVMDKPVSMLKLSTSSYLAMRWQFDRETLKALRADVTESHWAALKTVANILGTFADPSSTEALVALAGHPHFSVRWAAIQNLAGVNAEEAQRQLVAAVDDRHPAIRKAAARSLARSEKPVSPRAGT